MNAQEILTLVIESIFWVTVSFMLSQFITGLFVLRYKSYTVIQAQTTTVTPKQSAMSFDKPQNVYAPTTYCYEELPDPWTLETEVVETNNNQVVISFFTLKLLSPAKEVQPQLLSTTRRSKKISQPKSQDKAKTGGKSTTQPTTARKPRKSRKQVA